MLDNIAKISGDWTYEALSESGPRFTFPLKLTAVLDSQNK
jgi:hypothetical protein